ncbi:hypothetical protein BC940DRAFT_365746 [Gongronella butleri]|nr:hypothetical protein BC940DRAFT_365746 [Gongronella butleri]
MNLKKGQAASGQDRASQVLIILDSDEEDDLSQQTLLKPSPARTPMAAAQQEERSPIQILSSATTQGSQQSKFSEGNRHVRDDDDDFDYLFGLDSQRSVPLSQKHDNDTYLDTTQDQDDQDDGDSDDSLLSTSDLISRIRSGHAAKRQRVTTPTSTLSAKGRGKQRANSSAAMSTDENDVVSSYIRNYNDWDSPSTATSAASAPTSQSTMSQKELRAAQKQREKELNALERARVKEAKEAAKREKERAKADAQRAKDEARRVQQANRLPRDRTELIKDMVFIVHDGAFLASETGLLLKTSVLQQETTLEESPCRGCTLTWRQRRTAYWDDDAEQFMPYADGVERSEALKAALMFVTADELAEVVRTDRIDEWMDQWQPSGGPETQVFLMIEGLQAFYRKKLTWQRRQFTARVRDSMSTSNSTDDTPATSSSSSSSRKRRADPITSVADLPSKEKIEETLAYLQIVKDIMLLPTNDPQDSVDMLFAITSTLALAVYRSAQSSDLFKCQAPAHCGTIPDEVWPYMLQEIQMCTPAIAKGIAKAFPTPLLLYQHYQELDSQQQREKALFDLEVERGVLAQRGHGVSKSMSKKVHQIMTSTDPDLQIS